MPRAAFTTPSDIKSRLQRLWQRGDILASAVPISAPIEAAPLFPLRLPIKGPSSGQITADFEAVRDWIATWRQQKTLDLEWRSFSHRLFGENEMPAAAIIPDAETAVRILGTRREWDRFHEMISECRDRFPELLAWLAKRPMTALDVQGDWSALLASVEWIRDHPHCGLYLRQLDAPGVHTKLVEAHRKTLTELLDLVLPETAIAADATGVAAFEQRYGFRSKPQRIRFRFLDPASAIELERLGSDLVITAEAFAGLRPPVDRVFITENEVNFLAFPEVPRSLLIFGAGYGWSALEAARWLRQYPIYYWGDLDTHGFRILDQLRSAFPRVQSMLMTSEILLAHRSLWAVEPKPVTHDLSRLTDPETATFHLLRDKYRDQSPRLEQERLPFFLLQTALREITG